MIDSKTKIIINGKKLSANQINALAEIAKLMKVPQWEQDFFGFLNEWLSDSDFILVHTSGSTGKPKTIKLPKMVMQKSAERTIAYFGLRKGNKILHNLPCQFIAGKMMAVRAVVGQMKLFKIDPATDFKFLKDEKYDFGAMVPAQVFKILKKPSGKKKLQNIRNLLVGGSAISSELETRIGQLSNRVVSTYGMTETASHIAFRELSGAQKSDFYQCLPGIKVSLNKTGCLQIHLPELNKPLKTNDLAELQSDTKFKIIGRADSVIISGGIKYSPETIEKKIEPLINQRFIISSLPDEKLGEKLVLVIEGNPFDTEILEQKLTEILTPYEHPRSVLFIKKFTETASGKIIRKPLSQQNTYKTTVSSESH